MPVGEVTEYPVWFPLSTPLSVVTRFSDEVPENKRDLGSTGWGNYPFAVGVGLVVDSGAAPVVQGARDAVKGLSARRRGGERDLRLLRRLLRSAQDVGEGGGVGKLAGGGLEVVQQLLRAGVKGAPRRRHL
eukprot:3707818-Rhodomonas_salina.3